MVGGSVVGGNVVGGTVVGGKVVPGDEVVVVPAALAGAQSSRGVLGTTMRLANWSVTWTPAITVFGHRSL